MQLSQKIIDEIESRQIIFEDGSEAYVVMQIEIEDQYFKFLFIDGEIEIFYDTDQELTFLDDEEIKSEIFPAFFEFMSSKKENEELVRAMFEYFEYDFIYEKSYQKFLKEERN